MLVILAVVKIALIYVLEVAEVLVRENVKGYALDAAISVLRGVLNHALMAVITNVKITVVGAVHMSVAVDAEIVVVVAVVIIVIVRLTIMIKKNKPGLLMSPGLSFFSQIAGRVRGMMLQQG